MDSYSATFHDKSKEELLEIIDRLVSIIAGIEIALQQQTDDADAKLVVYNQQKFDK